TVATEQIENYLSEKTHKDLSAFFDQYLRTTEIPILEYKIRHDTITYRYTNIVPDFDMPIRIFIGDKTHWLFPNRERKTEKIAGLDENFEVDRNFYIKSIQVD
ncbi:MAG: M1 family peptidase, partial [Bacteroidota bacterium]